ncbi:hypothetical protein sos41_21240 [Alphaproteobacteria bacterium SO-S41]|nr:hypothetical protein sos41_21240 [Alphaproteobacteria bacterium SO-S41]
MEMHWIFLGIAAFTGGLITLIVYDKWTTRRRLLLWAILTVAFFGFMLLLEYLWGYGAAWNIFAFVFIGLTAFHSQKVLQKTFMREPQLWEGHPTQNPETEEFSDALKLTTNHLTGHRSGLVLAGPFDERYLADLTAVELDALAGDLAARDPKAAGLLTAYREWKDAKPA